MRRAGSLLLLLLLLSLSASTAEAHNKESSGDNAVPLTGRRWHLRGRRAMAARGHGAAGRDEAVGASNTGANPARARGGKKSVEVTVVGLGGESAGPRRSGGGRREFDGQVPLHSDYRTPREQVKKQIRRLLNLYMMRQGKRSKRPAARPMLQGASGHRHRHHGGDAAAMASDVLRMDYSVSVDVHSRRPINNDAPLDELMEKRP
ncbi:hypothetical protein VPH35_083775 [Triticum aestivum]|uniref:Uncharacterized protein n=1 Tax=Triticum aestivum TaxID=4565 RepID=A0A3B6KIA5_WHEAT